MNPTPILLLIFSILLWASPATADEPLREQLRYRLETLSEPGELEAGGQLLYAVAPLQELYLQRGWEPLWFVGRVSPPQALSQVIEVIDMAAAQGLEPENYHRSRLVDLLDQLAEARLGGTKRRLRIDIELLASDALLTLARDFAYGRIDPETIDPEWFVSREPPALLEKLAQAARGENLSLRETLETLLPTHPEYRALVERLALQRQLADKGGWALIESGSLLRPGELDPRVGSIRAELIRLGDMDGSSSEDADRAEDHYDPRLEQAMVGFQQRHGLDDDGIIGPQTLAALNTPPGARVDQLRANLERWRWLPRSLGDEYIIVNIAGFSMRVVNQGRTVMQQRVVVGTPYRRTPVFTGQMTYLVLNPSWEVPQSLAVRDQLPKIRENLEYLEEMGFALLQGWGVTEQRIDPTGVDWAALSARNFPYRLRQAPGPKNALGQVKFMFPNRHNVYLHDTPAHGLFGQEDRALSSGCIRLERPDDLTHWLLTERDSIMTLQDIEATADSGLETTVRLDRPIPVHLLYWTAWIDENGLVQYRHDIYQRDQRLLEALDAPAPQAI